MKVSNRTFIIILSFVASSAAVAISMKKPEVKTEESTEEHDLQKVESLVENFFTGLENKDTTALKDIMTMGGTFYASMENRPIFKSTHRGWMVNLVSNNSKLKERYWNKDIKIHKGIATVWTDYDFYIDGKLSHCGKNVMNLIKQKEEWKLADAYFTIEKDCAESPLGPYFEEQ